VASRPGGSAWVDSLRRRSPSTLDLRFSTVWNHRAKFISKCQPIPACAGGNIELRTPNSELGTQSCQIVPHRMGGVPQSLSAFRAPRSALLPRFLSTLDTQNLTLKP
jgi:hypothetical protein